MNSKNNLLYISLLTALPLTLLIGILLPLKHERYKAEIVDWETRSNYNSKYFVDWDSDGFSEYVLLDENTLGNAAIKPYSHSGISMGQFNLESKFIENVPGSFFSDIYNDGDMILFFLTQKNDSLFINGFHLVNQQFIFSHRFIDLVPVVNGINDFIAEVFNAFDANNDGVKEIYLKINARFSLQPRNFYRYDVQNDSLIKSPESYSKVISNITFDIDEDGTNEILCYNLTTDNYNDSISVPYPDSLSWTFVFTPDLQFKFPPIPFDGTASRLMQYPIKLNKGYGIIMLFSKRSYGSEKDCLIITDAFGNELNKLILPSTINSKNHRLFRTNIDWEYFLLVLSDGEKYIIDKNLNLDRKIKKSDFLNHASSRFIATNKKQVLHVLANRRINKIGITTLDLKNLVVLDIPVISENIISVRKNGKNFKLYFQNSDKGYYISYYKNLFYYPKFMIYPGIFLTLFFIIYTLFHFQQKRIIRQYETEKRLSQLQFQNIKNQLTPHFTFNVLNSIGLMVKSGKSEEAYNYLSRHSKMLRVLIDEANEVTHTLKKEIDFAKDYLSLQRLRFKNRYQFEINIDDQIDLNITVPKMIIHTYVENALKHGLKNINSGGILTINIRKPKENTILLEISDNGTGINKEQIKKNNGRGLKIMDEYFRLFEEYYNYNIKIQIDSLDPGNKIQPGTMVRIELIVPDL